MLFFSFFQIVNDLVSKTTYLSGNRKRLPKKSLAARRGVGGGGGGGGVLVCNSPTNDGGIQSESANHRVEIYH